jgi:hypothetical protein
MMASDATAARARRALLVSGVVSLLIAVLMIGALPTIGASEHQTQDQYFTNPLRKTGHDRRTY